MTTQKTIIFSEILSGLESSVASMVLGVLAIYMPQLASLAASDFRIIAANFRKFLDAALSGTPWGQALADMMTADWNAVSDSAKQAAIDFAEDVATVLEKVGIIPAP